MLPLALALLLGPVAHAEDEDAPFDPAAVIAVGPRAVGSAALVDTGWVGADLMGQISIEGRVDKRTAVRFEAGFNPVRGRVHVAGAGRAYPAGRGRVAWWAELSGHFQRTGARERDSTMWMARPARGWGSLPFLVGGGWRLLPSKTVVVDLGAHVGPTLEVRTAADFPVGFGFALTGHAYVGTAF